MAEHTEIVLCSHGHTAAIPGADGSPKSQNAEREASLLRSGGSQPGNNVQYGGMAPKHLGISSLVLSNS